MYPPTAGAMVRSVFLTARSLFVTNRFKWYLHSALIVSIQVFLSSIATIAAADMQVVDAPATSVPAKDPIAAMLQLPGKQNLAELIGTPEISVFADIDGQFVKNLTENQILENESTSQLGEAGLLESIRAGRSFSRENLAALSR